MKKSLQSAVPLLVACAFAAVVLLAIANEPGSSLTQVQRREAGETAVTLEGSVGCQYRIEASADLRNWIPLATVEGAEELVYNDPEAADHRMRFYRAIELEGSGNLTGDHLQTEDGSVLIHPVNHASFVMLWKDVVIYNDPVGGAGAYSGIPRADLLLVSHQHGDHFDSNTLNAVKAEVVVMIAPQSVFDSLSSSLKALTTVLSNGESAEVLGIHIEAVPAYNERHPKGRDNGYVLTIGGRRIYMAGDTEDVAEMRALEGIDVAFLPMNLPFTMSITQASDAVREFRPRVVYPYHFRNQGGSLADLEQFEELVGPDAGVTVRIRDWY